METKNKKLKFILLGSIVVIVILSGVAGFMIHQKQVKEDATVAAKKVVVEKKNDEELDAVSEEQYNTLKSNLSSVRSTFTLIHQMANTKIEAEDNQIWGKADITKGRCKALLEYYADHKQEAKEVFGEKDYEDLVDGIEKWSKGDYSKSSKVHNIVWEKLGGENGKAKEK